MICVFKGPLGTETICNGDSGGPLMVSINSLSIGSVVIIYIYTINLFLKRSKKHYQCTQVLDDSGEYGSQKHIQVGITSFAMSDCTSPFPGVFARITFYLEWIKAAITEID